MHKIKYVFLNIHISKTACAQFRTEHLDSAFLYYLLGLQFLIALTLTLYSYIYVSRTWNLYLVVLDCNCSHYLQQSTIPLSATVDRICGAKNSLSGLFTSLLMFM